MKAVEISDHIIHATTLQSFFRLKKKLIVLLPKSFLVDDLNWTKVMKVSDE